MHGHLARIAKTKAHGEVAEIRIDDLHPKEQLTGTDPSGRHGTVIKTAAPLSSHKVGIALLGELRKHVMPEAEGHTLDTLRVFIVEFALVSVELEAEPLDPHGIFDGKQHFGGQVHE